jgi:hypothetical protein
MPRKRPKQPEPLERFYLDDGTEAVIIDETCWPIGRGQHFSAEFEKSVQNLILEHLGTDLMDPRRRKIAAKYMDSPTNFASQIALWGVRDAEASDDTHVRKFWYPKIKEIYNTLLKTISEK